MLNLLALEALRAFVEGGNVAQAAARVHRTEPQVSRLLTSLQDAMGFPILRKEGRSLVLTPEGREFYEKVELLLQAADEVQGFSRETRRRRLDHVKVVAAPHIAEGLLADALARVKTANPKFTANVDARNVRDIEALLGQSQFDVALTQLPVEHPRVEVRELVRSQAVAVMKADHPLASHKVVTADLLRAHCMIHLQAQSVIRQRYEAALGRVEQAAHFEVSSGPLAAQLAAKGVGVALTDPFAALSQLPFGAAIRPFEPGIPLHYGVVLPKGRSASPATEALLGELAEVVRERLGVLRGVL
ncbi:MAG TPA: LysR family transcriptional regulator [Ramlibacter sp.]|nr:LysR family transcriptional regulator [Ramlibacter sp.]